MSDNLNRARFLVRRLDNKLQRQADDRAYSAGRGLNAGDFTTDEIFQVAITRLLLELVDVLRGGDNGQPVNPGRRSE